VRDAGWLTCNDTGRAAVVDGLRHGVLAVDRRFDARIPEVIDGPVCRADGIWMAFSLTLRRAGLPELRIEGEHLAVYEDGLIVALDEKFAPGMGEKLDAYLAEHGDALRPEGSPFNLDLSPIDKRDLDLAVNRTIVRCYGCAKSNQDIEAALATCGADFRLETVCLNLTTADRDEAAQQLAVFFTAFPDYHVTIEGIAAEGTSVACWGDAHMTFAGPFLGHAPTGRKAVVPFVSIFTCADAVLHGERFVFDLVTLCDQIGLPLSVVRDALPLLRAQPQAREPQVAVEARG
jgi:predicted ester cyclase